MNRKLAILLSALLFCIAFKDLLVYAQFYWNQAYFAQNLCINRANPESTCRGKCQLIKTFKDEKEQEQKCPNQKNEQKGQVVFLNTETEPLQAKPTDRLTKLVFDSYKSKYSFQFLVDIFHPPKCA